MKLARWPATYAATLAALLALDALWLGAIAPGWYRQALGPLLAPQPDLAAAGLFYLVYPLGLVIFAVAPHGDVPGMGRSALAGALFGFFAYATYDLSNLATLRGWPWGISVLDVAWGSALSAVASAAGKAVLDRLGGLQTRH
jgi:uncharacterized membrane protein